MSKSTLYPKKAKDIKGKTAIAELQRAHIIIVLLSFSVIPLLIIGTIEPIQFDPTLTTILVALLVVLGLASLVTAIVLRSSK